MTPRISFILATVIGLVMTASALAAPLSAYRWEARPLLIFAPETNEAHLTRQSELLERANEAIDERDMVVLLVTSDKENAVARFGPPKLKSVRAPQNEALRKAYSVAADRFTVILVGKDGGEKNRWSDVVEPQRIFDQIDSMPMRQREMREGG
ncbi:DUF4174 domain-containing protein [Fulvimarina sp. MAC8]|uniref:DUF4174 domain-containing protein n=1 Tax=Fulvimarina sp. MAC8 TaxID=3162874 RepID=UPI0032ECC9C1